MTQHIKIKEIKEGHKRQPALNGTGLCGICWHDFHPSDIEVRRKINEIINSLNSINESGKINI